MLGTITELENFYLPRGANARSSLIDLVGAAVGNGVHLGGWTPTEFLSLYGAPSSTQEIISLTAGADALMRVREEAAGTGLDFAPTFENIVTKLALDSNLADAMARNKLDASNLPPFHPSWRQQKIYVADEGVLPVGKIVYIALRIGLLAQANPFPDRIAAVVVAASGASFKYGSWTSQASSAARKSTVDEVGAWGDDNRVYILLPRQCFLGPGATGDVACAAYGVGWARDGKLENYVDVLSGREEVREPVELFRKSSCPSPLFPAVRCTLSSIN